MTREQAGHRGPVRYVRIEQQQDKGAYVAEFWYHPDGRLSASAHTNADGSAYRTHYTYDEHGELIDPCRDCRVIRNADGSRREIDRIPPQMNLAWGRICGLEKAGGIGFPTRMATQVEVTYDPRDVPVEAVFTYDNGEIASRVEFRSDRAGNITEILQYGGSRPVITLEPGHEISDEDRRKFAAFLTAGALEVRSSIAYDDYGNRIERTAWMGNELMQQTTWTYNERGDIATSTEKDGWPVRFEYEYDEHGNWTRQVVTHGMGSDETVRKFQYYD